jgi:hypothetical protein
MEFQISELGYGFYWKNEPWCHFKQSNSVMSHFLKCGCGQITILFIAGATDGISNL